jgi:hypothetical protein
MTTTRQEIISLVVGAFFDAEKSPAQRKLKRLAEDDGVDLQNNRIAFAEWLGQKLNGQLEPQAQQRPNSRVKDRFKRHSPRVWIDEKMYNSAWAKAGFPEITNKDDAQAVLDGVDAILGFPSYRDCTWEELENAPGNRPGFLIKMIVALENFNDKYAYLKR